MTRRAKLNTATVRGAIAIPRPAGLDVLDRAATLGSLWLIYPVLLFSLRDDARIAGVPLVAPETVILGALYLFFLLTGGAAVVQWFLHAIARTPRAPWALLVVIEACSLYREDWAVASRVVVWGATYAFACAYVQLPGQARRLLLVWQGVAIAEATFYYASPELWAQQEINIFAWKHRTTFSYFLAVPFLYRVLTQVAARVKPSFITFAGGAVLAPALILCFSRGPWAAVAGGLAVCLAASRRYLLAVVIVIGMLTAGAALWGSDSPYWHRIRSVVDLSVSSSAGYRLDLYRAAVRLTQEVWLTGSGTQQAGSLLGSRTDVRYGSLAREKVAVDSDLIWALLEGGVAAVLSLVWISIWWLGKAMGIVRRQRAALGFGNLGLAITFLIFILFDNSLGTPLGWFMLGAGIGMTSSLRGALPVSACRTGNVQRWPAPPSRRAQSRGRLYPKPVCS